MLLGAVVPVVALGLDGDLPRSMFDGRYVVDDFSIVFKALFLLAGYVVVLLSQQYIEDGDYYEGEYYALLLTSVLGMMLMPSARDLVTIFVALETLSIPAYMLASWRKRDRRSNEAGVKYYLLGVFSSAVMLYGMSLLYGATGSTKLVDIGVSLTGEGRFSRVAALSVVFVLVGFAFKVSAVPFHSWAPDTYEGAPTPITAFLSVGVEGRRVRRPRDADLHRLPPGEGHVAAVPLGVGGADDDRRQPARPAPDQRRAHVRLLLDQPGRFHPDAAGRRRHRRRGARRRCSRWSSTCSSTRPRTSASSRS